jgi:hypothetical protein
VQFRSDDPSTCRGISSLLAIKLLMVVEINGELLTLARVELLTFS